jgi:hypothetical protein
MIWLLIAVIYDHSFIEIMQIKVIIFIVKSKIEHSISRHQLFLAAVAQTLASFINARHHIPYPALWEILRKKLPRLEA